MTAVLNSPLDRVFFAKAYMAIGAVVGSASCVSYVQQAWRSSDATLNAAQNVALLIGGLYVGFASAILRAFFWLPSLAIWCVTPDATFAAWLLPGTASAFR